MSDTANLCTVGARGVWWLRYQARGVRKKLSLRTTDHAEALIRRDAILAKVADEQFHQQAATRELLPPARDLDTRILDALTLLIQRVNAMEARLTPPTVPPLPLASAWERYTLRHPVSVGHSYGREAAFKSFTSHLAAQSPTVVTVQAITPDHVAAWLDHSRSVEKAHPNTLHKRLAVLRTWFKAIAQEAGLTANPFTQVRASKVAGDGRRSLTLDELRTIITTAPADLRTLFLVAAYTGARLGDAATLDWCSIDLAAGRCVFRQSKTQQPLTLPLHPDLAAHLAMLPPPHTGPVVPALAELYRSRGADPLTKRVQAHIKACGITTTGQGGGKRRAVVVGFHSLRHSFISMQAEAGAAPAVLQSLAGHTDSEMTRRYVHISDHAARLSIASLPSFNPVSPP